MKADIIEATLNGGPNHGSTVTLINTRVQFLSAPEHGGYYSPVQGGSLTDYYWHEGETPRAYERNGALKPIGRIIHD